MDRDEVEVNKLAIKEQGQYPAILTEQAWSIKDLLKGLRGNFSCGKQRVVPRGPDSSILPVRVANHSGPSCRRFHMTLRQLSWCTKRTNRRPCWCSKPILLELNSIPNAILFQQICMAAGYVNGKALYARLLDGCNKFSVSLFHFSACVKRRKC